MGTRSRIGVMHGDVLKSVYCHWDGYLDNNGQILAEHYDSPKANHLVSLGDLSSLGPNIGDKHDFDNPCQYGTQAFIDWQEEKSKVCTFYGRDRDEQGTEYKVSHSFEEFLNLVDRCGAEYYYIMRDGEWFAGAVYEVDGLIERGLVPLREALAKISG